MEFSDTCTHSDVRRFDNISCCLSCGETFYLSRQPRCLQAAEIPTNTGHNGLKQSYDDVRLSSGQHIRLITLIPGEFSDPIFCKISEADLSSRPNYAALSYTWATEDGDDKKTGRIHCDGGLIPVTENCEAALRRLRSPCNTQTLWVDAVCINQSNIKERNHQVDLMSKIYRSASQVHIHIEDRKHTYRECMRFLNDGIKPGIKLSDIILINCQLEELLKRRYFTRVWIIQEIVLAKTLLLHVNGDTTPLGHQQILDLRVTGGGHVLSLKTKSNHELSITTWLARSFSASAGDPRDHVLGIVSLLNPNIRPLIPVEYSLCYIETIRNAITACIADHQSLSIITYASLRRGRRDRHRMSSVYPCCDQHPTNPLSYRGRDIATLTLENFKDYLEKNGVQKSFGPPTATQNLPGYRKAVVFSVEGITKRESQDFSYIERLPSVVLTRQILPRLKVRGHLIDIICYPEHTASGTAQLIELNYKYLEHVRNELLAGSRPLPSLVIAVIKEILTEMFPSERLQGLMNKVRENILAHLYGDILLRKNDSMISKFREDQQMKVNCLKQILPNAADKLLLQKQMNISNQPAPEEPWSKIYPGSPIWSIHEYDLFRFLVEFSINSRSTNLFHTNYSVGFTDCEYHINDHIFIIDSVSQPMLLREASSGTYRIIGPCYLWAATELDYWNPGTHKGLWPDRPYDLGEQTRMIEIY